MAATATLAGSNCFQEESHKISVAKCDRPLRNQKVRKLFMQNSDGIVLARHVACY